MIGIKLRAQKRVILFTVQSCIILNRYGLWYVVQLYANSHIHTYVRRCIRVTRTRYEKSTDAIDMSRSQEGWEGGNESDKTFSVDYRSRIYYYSRSITSISRIESEYVDRCTKEKKKKEREIKEKKIKEKNKKEKVKKK